MPEEISNPLLSLIKEQGLIDDLQYEEVVAEIQAQQHAGHPGVAGFRHHETGRHPAGHGRTHLGTRSSRCATANFRPNCCRPFRPTSRGCIIACPSRLNNGTVQVALADPLDPARADEIQFAVKRDVQIVVADPGEIEKAIERLYGQDESEGFSEILKELGSDADIAREVSAAGDDATSRRGAGQRSADREVRQSGFAPGHSGPRERHSFRAV